MLLPASPRCRVSRPAAAGAVACRAIGAALLLLTVLFVPGLAGAGDSDEVLSRRAIEQARRFDRVDAVVRRRYYAPDLHAVDWPALCARYRPAAIAAAGEAEWYALVNAMLDELGDAHTRVVRPGGEGRPRGSSRRMQVGPVAVRNEIQVLETGHVILRFDRFDAASVRWLRAQLKDHAGAPGIVLDLRSNRGGLIRSAQQAVGLFFVDPVPMGWVVSRSGRRWLERSRGGRFHTTIPAAVLIGPGSHSSAEVFAYVLRHHGRAVLIGAQTAGEVLGARRHRLPDGGSLFVSETDFQRLEGGRLEGEGVVPDFAPAVAGQGPIDSVDADLAAAIRYMAARDFSQVVGNQVVPPRGLEPRTN